jgi:superfamily II DNA or RNA helicase
MAQIYAPTGSGKTILFTKTIEYIISKGANNICIVYPRLMLSQEQIVRLKKDMGEDFVATSFNSGAHVNTEGVVIEECNTTNPEELKALIKVANEVHGQPHITFTTYNSFEKIIDFKFDLVIFDEAHYLSRNDYNQYPEKVKSVKALLYTATPISKDDPEDIMEEESIGMSEKRFGTLIASIAPHILIEQGFIVAPLIHELNCKTTELTNEVDVVDVVARAFYEQHKEVIHNGMPYAQMVVAARGVETDIAEINRRYAELQRRIYNLNPDIQKVNIYTITSESSVKNGKHYNNDRMKLIADVKKSGENAIIVHFNTISEGIDIDTLTGVCFLRSVMKATFIQTIGRASRPYRDDLDENKTPKKELFGESFDHRKKPRCIVTLPIVDGNHLGNMSGEYISAAFIAGGYKELTTYLEDEDNPTSLKKVQEEPQYDEDVTKPKNFIKSYRLNKLLEILEALNKKSKMFGDYENFPIRHVKDKVISEND